MLSSLCVATHIVFGEVLPRIWRVLCVAVDWHVLIARRVALVLCPVGAPGVPCAIVHAVRPAPNINAWCPDSPPIHVSDHWVAAQLKNLDLQTTGVKITSLDAPTAHTILYDQPSVMLALARRVSRVGTFNRTISQITSEFLDEQSGTYVTSY